MAKKNIVSNKQYNTRYHRLANYLMMGALVLYGIIRAITALRLDHPNQVIISAVAVGIIFVLMFTASRFVKVGDPSWYMPFALYITYVIASLMMQTFTYYFAISAAILVISALYLNKKAMLAFIIVLAASGLVLALLGYLLVSPERPVETVPLIEVLVDWVLLTLTSIALYIFTRFAADKNESASRDQDAFDTLFATTPNMTVLMETDGTVTYISKRMLEILGLTSAEDAQGKNIFDLLDNRHSKELFREMLTSEGPFETIRSLRSEGTSHFYRFVAERMHGDTEGFLVDISDISDIMAARLEAEAASRAKGDFLANMSHEIRTPLNAILGMTTIGEAATELERKDYCFGRIEEASTHLLGIISDILDMSKIEAGKLELAPTNFEFAVMLERVCSIMEVRLREKQLAFCVEVDEALPTWLFGDEQRLAQVLTNLIGNAQKFTPEGGKVTLTVRLAEASATSPSTTDGSTVRLHFEVHDTGIGISEEEIEGLFAKFNQAENSTTRAYGGTGLGLTISKSITELMNGSIGVVSTPGVGSTFWFEVELARAEPAEVPPPAPAVELKSRIEAEEQPDFSNHLVLLVEDVDINREIVSALLEPTGIGIECAVNGQEAVDCFSSAPERYDIIFMDIQMPVMDGYDAARHIRASGLPRASSIPIIAMTANVFKEDVEHALESGMNGHLGKPLNLAAVLDTLRLHLS